MQAGFNGDFSGLTIPRRSDAHPIRSDTRNRDPYAPANEVTVDEDVFTDSGALPSGGDVPSRGHVGRGG